MNFDEINNIFYNAHTDDFDKIPFSPFLQNLLSNFITYPSHILEIGSGPGALGKWLKGLGHNLLCLEPAKKAAEKAKEKGLEVLETRFQDFHSNEKFDFIIAISSLIHIPRNDIPNQLNRISSFLKKEGLAFITFLEGTEEGYDDPTQIGNQRFFSKFFLKDLEKITSADFTILEYHKLPSKSLRNTFYLFILKNNQ